MLFVSQKAQALKVVKDKLKKLDVKYLFGYLPNPNSAQIGEEDEADGIAPQLSALGSHIEKLGYKFNARRPLVEFTAKDTSTPAIDQIVNEKEKNRNALNTIIAIQREVYQLHQELLQLNEYDIDISDFKCFANSFSSDEWREIKSSKSEIESSIKIIKKYERSDEKKEFDNLFSSIDLNDKHFAEALAKVRGDVAKTGYDRHSTFFRRINNVRRNLRLGNVRENLPREIIDYIDKVLMSNMSRNDQTKKIDFLYNHCYYYENVQRLKMLRIICV